MLLQRLVDASKDSDIPKNVPFAFAINNRKHCGVSVSNSLSCSDQLERAVTPKSCMHVSCSMVSPLPLVASRKAASSRLLVRIRACCCLLLKGILAGASLIVLGITLFASAIRAAIILRLSRSASPAPSLSRSRLCMARFSEAHQLDGRFLAIASASLFDATPFYLY